MFKKIALTCAAALTVAALAAAPASAHHDELEVCDSSFNCVILPTPQPTCEVITAPVDVIDNHTNFTAVFFFDENCSSGSFIVNPDETVFGVPPGIVAYLAW